MPKPWSAVASSPGYQALPPDQQEAARSQYFDQVVAPQLQPAQVSVARQQFDAQTKAAKAPAAKPESNGFFKTLSLPANDPGSVENRIRGVFGAPAVGKNAEYEKTLSADSPFAEVTPTSPTLFRDMGQAVGEGAKYLVRGGEAGAQKIQQALQTFGRAGTTPSIGQATGSRGMQAAESILGKYPGSAGVLAKKGEQQAADIGNRVTAIADKLSPSATPSVAGRTIEKGLSGEGGFVDRFKEGQRLLYDQLDRHIPQSTPVNVGNTARVLQSMNQSIEGANALSSFFKNGKIQDIEAAFKKDVSGTPGGVLIVPPNATTAEQRAAASHGLLKQRSAEIREGQAPLYGRSAPIRNPYTGKVGPSTRMAGRPGQRTVEPNQAAASTYAAGQKIGLPPGSPTNQLPYEAVKKLRSLVGEQLESSELLTGVKKSVWKNLYASLSKDMEGAAKATGNPAASRAMARANRFSRAGYARIDDVLQKVSNQNIPEKLFQSAVNPADMQAGATKIGTIMKSLSPAERDVVKSAYIRRMGVARPSAQGAEGDAFSSETFLTNWNKMSPQAKDVMFSGNGGELRKDMDAIANTAERIREGAKVFQNVSGSGPAIAATGLVSGVGTAALTGNYAVASAMLGTAAGANLTSRLMTSPKFVSWLAKSAKITNPDIARQSLIGLINAMRYESQGRQDDARRYAASVDQSLGAPK